MTKQSLVFSHPPRKLNESDPMFGDSSVPKIKELQVKTDQELSNDEPSDDYAAYIWERNTESQKLAKMLEVPKRPFPQSGRTRAVAAGVTSGLQGLVGDLGRTAEASTKGVKPLTALVE